jgi:hypothetical protein
MQKGKDYLKKYYDEEKLTAGNIGFLCKLGRTSQTSTNCKAKLWFGLDETTLNFSS